MSSSKECRKCGEPVRLVPEENRFECPRGCGTDPDTEIDEAEYTSPDR